MFTELMPLLKLRALTITVAGVGSEQIRVNVVPHSRPEDKKINEQISYSHKSEVASVPDEAVKALTTPISITGTADEIDAKFPELLTNYVDSHSGLQTSFDRASGEISAAVKAIDERNKAKTKDKQAKKEENNETLPLWWTDPSAPAPGTTQPASAAASSSSAPAQPTLVSQTAEVTQP